MAHGMLPVSGLLNTPERAARGAEWPRRFCEMGWVSTIRGIMTGGSWACALTSVHAGAALHGKLTSITGSAQQARARRLSELCFTQQDHSMREGESHAIRRAPRLSLRSGGDGGCSGREPAATGRGDATVKGAWIYFPVAAVALGLQSPPSRPAATSAGTAAACVRLGRRARLAPAEAEAWRRVLSRLILRLSVLFPDSMARLSELLLLVSASAFCASATGVSLAASDDLIQVRGAFAHDGGVYSGLNDAPCAGHVDLQVLLQLPTSSDRSSMWGCRLPKRAPQLPHAARVTAL